MQFFQPCGTMSQRTLIQSELVGLALGARLVGGTFLQGDCQEFDGVLNARGNFMDLSGFGWIVGDRMGDWPEVH